VLEINVTEHCNLRCQHCDHSSPLLQPRLLSPAGVYDELSVLSAALKALELRIVGGEPLLHPDLVEVISEARRAQFARKITLVTNGTLLHRMPRAIWRLIDGMWISLYPDVKRSYDSRELRQEANRHGVWIWEKECRNFDASLLGVKTENDALVAFIYERCVTHPPRFSYCTVRSGRFFMCQRAAFMEDRLRSLEIDYACSEADSVELRGGAQLGVAIREYLGRTTPLRACRYCLGSAAMEVKWTQARESQQSLVGASAEDRLSPSLALPKQLLE